VWSAVARKTRTGKSLGPEQGIGVEDALRAVTSDAAWAHFEEQRRGSLAPGKLADLVLLGADPTAVPPDEIPEIAVTATFKEGALIHGAL
jgi:predicted amidohydrolase YtcJ